MMRYFGRRTKLSSLLPGLLVIPIGLLASMVLIAWGILEDSMVLAVQLVAGLYGGIALWRWMTGAVWRPAIILLAQIPFQGILGMYLGTVANFVTWLPIAAFLVQIPRGGLVRSLFGTRTQSLLGILIFALAFSVVIAIPAADLSGLLRDFGQKITLVFIVAALACAFLEPGFDRKALMTISVSMTIMVALALMEHYLGLSIVGSAPKEFIHLGDYRLSGPGGSLPINRMAFYHILPLSLVLGSLLTRRARPNFLTITAVIILGVGLVSTGSRGGLLGTLAALGLVWWLSRSRIASGILVGMVIVAALVIVSTIVPPEAFTRSEGAGMLTNAGDRFYLWNRAIGYFLRNPILGLGWGQLEATVWQVDPYLAARTATTAHNSLLQMLSESGLVGTLPFIVLCWHVLTVLWRGAGLDAGSPRLLGVGAFAAFAGMLLATMTSVYQFERYFWVPVGYAASLELLGARASAQTSG